MIRRRGKWRASKESFDIILFGVTSSPISLADCKPKFKKSNQQNIKPKPWLSVHKCKSIT